MTTRTESGNHWLAGEPVEYRRFWYALCKLAPHSPLTVTDRRRRFFVKTHSQPSFLLRQHFETCNALIDGLSNRK